MADHNAGQSENVVRTFAVRLTAVPLLAATHAHPTPLTINTIENTVTLGSSSPPRKGTTDAPQG